MQFNITGRNAPHVAAAPGVGAVMRQVMYALVPGTLVYSWFFGWGVLSNVLLAILFAIAFEAVALQLRKRSIAEGLSDYSAVVTAWLFALAIPPMSSWWLIAVGIGFAIVVAKHVYGGLGYNPFNPAMVGYVVLLISFPREMTLWLAPEGISVATMSLPETLNAVFTGQLPTGQSWDAITRATPLDSIKTDLGLGLPISEISRSSVFGSFAGSGWEWVSLAWLLGGAWLLFRRIITWHIPVGLIASILVMSGIFWLVDGEQYASPMIHLFSGATMIGAFFIATDPVTAASSDRGRIVYAAAIGVLTYVIRVWGGYPDAIAFAVLLANMCAPTIDYYFRPRAFGH